MARYVALLRGINVGGKNLIKMPALAACFEDAGFADVATYIQSGNVLFSAARQSNATLTGHIEQLLAKTFGYDATVVVRSHAQLRTIVQQAPTDFGTEPSQYRYDVIFLKPPLTAPTALRDVPTREGVDEVHAAAGVLYFSRLVSRLTQSRLSKIGTLPIYQSMTIRNWNTTTTLLTKLDAAARRGSANDVVP